MSLERFLSVHIPKTAGTELQHFFTEKFGPEHVYFYYETRGGLYPATRKWDPEPTLSDKYTPILFMRNMLVTVPFGKKLYQRYQEMVRKFRTPAPTRFPRDFSMIHGHFTADHFKQQVNKVQLVTVVREPFERAVSHYHFWQNLLATTRRNQVPGWFQPTMTLEEFCKKPAMVNLQSSFLGSHPLDHFAYVGVSDRLREYCDQFRSIQRNFFGQE